MHSARHERIPLIRPSLASNRISRPGFTLVELLVSIGIITILIALTLAGAGRMREQARRIEDLSNLRQLTAACIAYASENRGYLPPGRLARAKPGQDNYAWINYSRCWKLLTSQVSSLASIVSCSSVRMGYAEAFEFGKLNDEYGDDIALGWIYWGGRDDLYEGSQVKYRSLTKIGQRLTPGSPTLWTCWCWDSNGTTGPSISPHVGSKYVEYPPNTPLKPAPDGLGIALTDGSATFVPWAEMIIIPQANGWKLYYQP